MLILLSEIKTLEDLKAKGSFKVVKASINELIPIKARGWKELWFKIELLKKLTDQYYCDFNKIMTSSIASELANPIVLSIFKTPSLPELRKYLWFTMASRRKYNFYLSSIYEGVDYFKLKEDNSNEVQRN